MRRLLVCVVLLVACKKKSAEPDPGSASAGTGSAPVVVAIDAASPAGSGSAPAPAAALPPEVAAFEGAVAALLKEPEGDARSKKTCGQMMDLKKQARAVAQNKPAGVDQAAWDQANDAIASSFQGLGPHCNDDPPDDSIDLPEMHKNIQALIALLPK
jgi:hypothetical protein